MDLLHLLVAVTCTACGVVVGLAAFEILAAIAQASR